MSAAIALHHIHAMFLESSLHWGEVLSKIQSRLDNHLVVFLKADAVRSGVGGLLLLASGPVALRSFPWHMLHRCR